MSSIYYGLDTKGNHRHQIHATITIEIFVSLGLRICVYQKPPRSQLFKTPLKSNSAACINTTPSALSQTTLSSPIGSDQV